MTTPGSPPVPSGGPQRQGWAGQLGQLGQLKAAAATGDAERARPIGWRNALFVMLALAGALWIIEIIDQAANLHLDRDGLRPRDIDGLIGIVTSPFLHAGFGHLLADSVPFVLIGWVVLVSGVRPFLISSAIIIVAGGLVTWLISPSVGPDSSVVGASGLVMGWLGYLLGRAYFSRRILWIVTAVLVVFFFGTLLGGVLPSVSTDISWQAHLAGFAAGIFAAWLMHPRPGRARSRRAAGERAPESTGPPQPLS